MVKGRGRLEEPLTFYPSFKSTNVYFNFEKLNNLLFFVSTYFAIYSKFDKCLFGYLKYKQNNKIGKLSNFK